MILKEKQEQDLIFRVNLRDLSKFEVIDGKCYYENYPKFEHPTGSFVLCNESQNFEIEILAPDDENVYGADLFIDGTKIEYKKTFKKRGTFKGFKIGNGSFQHFTFKPPNITEAHDKDVMTQPAIQLRFYGTKTIHHNDPTKILNKAIRKATDKYKPSKLFENKKYYQKSLTVQPGQLFDVTPVTKEQILKWKLDKNTGKFKEHLIDRSKTIEEQIIKYGDFIALQCLNVISLSRIDHLKYLPSHATQFLTTPSGIKQFYNTAFETILSSRGNLGMTVQDLEAVFQEYTKIPFEILQCGSLRGCIDLEVTLQRYEKIDGKFYLKEKNQESIVIQNIFLQTIQ